MAHIVSCMVESDLDTSSSTCVIMKPPSPTPSVESATTPAASACESKPFVWRMQQQPDARKYQLFPKDRQAPSAPPKGLDPEQARAYALGQAQNADKPDQGRSSPSNGLRIRIKEHNLVRRRKVSVPELGPMTTVQEVAMDSPTIPGRPPIHERSISAPGNSSNPSHMTSAIGQATVSPIPKQLMSPKSLAPLIIPSSTASTTTAPNPSSQHNAMHGLARQPSLGRLRSGSTPYESTCQRSARVEDWPKSSRTPYTPMSSSTSLTTPLSAAATATTIPSATIPPTASITTPVSAPVLESSKLPSWESGTCTIRAGTASADETAKTDTESRKPAPGHRRGHSESGSIMDRGRPKKRTNMRRNGSLSGAEGLKRTESTGQKAHKAIPTGYKASEAANKMKNSELEALQKQAYSQASRFEVLRGEDVEALSRELRQLDDRTEYLRRTYSSLRAGRRNLHSRICQYLRSPRVAKFSTDAMLRQEESLAELDASIDDWMNKLEQAEQRRSLVRQKLLEHVAAAVTLPMSPGTAAAASESLQQAMGLRTPAVTMNGLGNISTPPRSPTKTSSCSSSRNNSSSPSPQRVAANAHVPSTIIEQPHVEEAESMRRLTDSESIRVYADSDVYALLADVEDEISKMGVASQQDSRETKDPREARVEVTATANDARKQVCRARSDGMLRDSVNIQQEEISFLSPPTPSTSVGHSSPPRDRDTSDIEPIFLTSAVFKP